MNPVIKGETYQPPHQRDTHQTRDRLTVGPANGPRAKNDSAFPRSSGAHRSLSIALQGSCQSSTMSEGDRKAYPAFVSGAAAKNPPKKRKMSRAAVLGANAFPT